MSRARGGLSRLARCGVVSGTSMALMAAGGLAQIAVAEGTPGWTPGEKPALWSPSPLPVTPSVSVTPAGGGTTAKKSATPMREFTPTATKWPAAASVQVSLTGTPARSGVNAGAGSSGPKTATTAKAAGTPVTVGAPGVLTKGLLPQAVSAKKAEREDSAAAVPSSVSVQVAGHPASAKAGIRGFAVTLRQQRSTRAPMAASRASVALDYSSIADAYGGDFASRLRLVELPACALTTPTAAGCRTQTPVAASVNDVGAHQLVGDVALPAVSDTSAGTVVLAADAAPSGGAGSYTATSLAPSGQWAGGGSTGAFTYDYPITVPPSVGGDAPKVALDYNSASVDGRTSTTNNQASWIGDGWDYNPGYIERSYRSCADDAPDDTTLKTDFDECWAGDNATISLAGHSGDLVPTSTAGKWRLSDDDGSTVEELSGATNGLNSGTFWRLTTDDGTQYYFGADHLPSDEGGKGTDTSTNAAWGIPVYGNDTGEPCHASTFAASSCTQGWRWNLDFVIDPNQNITTYDYKAEQNYYGAGASHTLTAYTRGGYLSTISYGQRVPDYVAKATPGAMVTFGVMQRCNNTPTTGDCAAPTTSTASHWPDVPFDQNCASTGACTNYSPTFWSTMRLHTITTKVWDESLSTPGWSNVDTYTLNQTYPALAGDGAKPAMWLAGVTHDGSDTRAGDTTAPHTLPALTLTGQATLPNRVDGLEEPKDISPLYRYRLQSLTTETGESITVTYRQDTCSRTSPPSETADTSLCYPVRWTPPGYDAPILDWFYIYPVAEVDQTDNKVTESADQITTYTYSHPAWHRDDSEITTTKYRSYGDFRGFSQVITRTGKSPDPITQSETDYLQGMGGTVTDLMGDTLTDDNALSGYAYQTAVYDKDGGTPQSETVNQPWLSKVTATHARGSGLPDLTAQMSDIDKVDTRQLKADGTWRMAEATTAFDSATGLPTAVDDKGEIDSSGNPLSGTTTTPEKCVSTSYASDTARNMQNYPDQVITEAGPCVTTPDAHTLSATRTWYDSAASGGALGAISGAGNPTATQKAKLLDGSSVVWAKPATTSYDAYGRATEATDPLGRTTGTSYGATDTAKKYLPVKTVATNAKGWNSTTTLDPGRQRPLTATDFNGRLTTETYDGLGRLTKVWLPDHTQADNASTPNDKYNYTVSATAPSTVESESLLNGGNYGVEYQIYDSMLQVRQDQSSPKDGGTGRLITDTAYDSHGWTTSTDAAFYNKDSNPTGGFVNPLPAQVPSNTRTTFDGQGRATANSLYSLGTKQWTTTTVYPGADETDVTPPTGGTPTATLTDVRGQTTELRQYHSATPAGTYDKTDYAYDAAGQTTKNIGPVASTTDLASAAAQAVTWSKTYDLLGDVIQQNDPDTGTVNSTYDDDSEVTQAIDGRPDQTGRVDTTYDVLGRVTGTSGWNAADSKAVPLTSRTYDDVAKGEPTSVTAYENGKAAYTSSVTGYTTGYQPSGATITIPAGAYGNDAAITYTTAATYTDPQDLLDTSKISTSGTGNLLPDETLYYSHNGMGLPVGVGGTDDYTGWIDYTPLGQIERTTQGLEPKQVVTTDNWDMATGHLLSYANDREEDTDGTAATSAVDNVSYTYNPAGQITSTSDVQDDGGAANTDTQCYTYDYLARLTQAWTDTGATHTADSPTVPGIGGCDNTTPAAANLGGPAPYWESYGYDLTGNRTSKTVHDTSGDTTKDATTNETYDTPGHTHAVHTATTGDTTQTYTYDADGNPTAINTTTGGQAQADQAQKLTWDTQGDLATFTTGPAAAPTHTTGYHYDADGNLTARTDDGTTTIYLGSDEITLNSAGIVTSANRSYGVAGAPTTIRTATTGTAGSRLDYQLADPQGTSTADITADTLTVTRRAYTPFGNTRTATPDTWPGDKGYIGGTTDPTTGLTNLGAREYNPILGRFLSPDPLRTPADPQQWNGYAYADNTPIDSSDPTGQMLKDDMFGYGFGNAQNMNDWYHDQGYTDSKGHATRKYQKLAFSEAVAYYTSQFEAQTTYHKPRNPVRTIVIGKIAAIANGLDKVSDAANPGCWFSKKLCSSDSGAIDKAAAGLGADTDSEIYKAAEENGAEALALAIGGEFGAEEQVEAEVGKSEVGCSFDPQTPVLLASGKTKAIGKIKTGDLVEAADPATGKKLGGRTVQRVWINHDSDLLDVTVEGADKKTATLHTTANHPFWDATSRIWVLAGELIPGHALNTADGTRATVLGVHTTPGAANRWNLTVQQLHTYYVLAGATPVLVHNNGCGVAIDSGKWDYFFGRVASNPHNAERSAQNAYQLESIGIRDNAEGRKILTDHFNEALRNSSSEDAYVNAKTGLTNLRTESLLYGPHGALLIRANFEVTDKGVRLTTMIPVGGRGYGK